MLFLPLFKYLVSTTDTLLLHWRTWKYWSGFCKRNAFGDVVSSPWEGRMGFISITGLPSLPVQGSLQGCPSVFLIFLTLCRLLVVVFQFVCNLSYHVLIEGKGCQLFKTSSGVFIYICWTAALSCLTLICSRPVRNIHKLAKDNTSAKYIGRWLEILKTDVIWNRDKLWRRFCYSHWVEVIYTLSASIFNYIAI